MPYATDTIKASVRGTINTSQSWSTSFWFATSGFPPLATYGVTQLNGLRDSTDLQGYWQAWWSSLKTYAGINCDVNMVQYSLYEGASRAATATSEWSTGSSMRGAGGHTMPPECALVVTMQTNTTGGSGRGRSYFPWQAAVLDATTGLATVGDAGSLVGAYSTLLSAIAGHDFDTDISGGTTYNLVPSLASYLKGTNHPLTKVGVDTRVDSQRRREHKLPGAKIWATL